MSDDLNEAGDAQLKAGRQARRQRRNLRKAYADGLLNGIAAMLRPGDLAIDCGANMGVVTAVLAETGAEVVSFEPDPFAFEQLQLRFGNHSRVTLIQAAVGVKEGQAILHRAANFDENPEGASVKSTLLIGGRMIDDTAGIAVPVVDFPAFLAERLAERGEIAFVKMDIEGAELDILEHLEQRGLLSPIRCLVAETHERKFRDLRPRFKALRERIGAQFPPNKINLDWI